MRARRHWQSPAKGDLLEFRPESALQQSVGFAPPSGTLGPCGSVLAFIRLVSEKLYSTGNDIGVSSFILPGAPNSTSAEQSWAPRICVCAYLSVSRSELPLENLQREC